MTVSSFVFSSDLSTYKLKIFLPFELGIAVYEILLMLLPQGERRPANTLPVHTIQLY